MKPADGASGIARAAPPAQSVESWRLAVLCAYTSVSAPVMRSVAENSVIWFFVALRVNLTQNAWVVVVFVPPHVMTSADDAVAGPVGRFPRNTASGPVTAVSSYRPPTSTSEYCRSPVGIGFGVAWPNGLPS